MIEALVVLGCVLGCVVLVAAPVPPSEAIDPDGARAGAMRRAELRVAATVLSGTTFACLSLVAIGHGIPRAVLPLAIGWLVAQLVLHPWVVVRSVCIPLGWPRWAYGISRLGGHPWVRDPEGGACLAGALACLRRRRRDPDAAKKLRERLERGPLRGAGIVAAALLAADAGEPAQARDLLESLDLLDPDACPPHARDVARHWSIADAARRGAWQEVLEACRTTAHIDPTTRLFRVCAMRMLGGSVRWRTLLFAWMRAPRRWATASLVRLALRRKTGSVCVEAGADDVAANEAALSHHRAVAMHCEAAASAGSRDAASLERVSRGWDATLWDLGFRGHVRQRIRALGGRRSPERTALELRRNVGMDVASWWTGLPPARRRPLGRGDVLQAAREVVIRTTARKLEHRVAHLARRRASDPLTIWQHWLEIRAHHETLVSLVGPSHLRAIYWAFEHTLAGMVVHLHGTRGQRALAHSMSLWLVEEAERAHDAIAAAHHRRNAAFGP